MKLKFGRSGGPASDGFELSANIVAAVVGGLLLAAILGGFDHVFPDQTECSHATTPALVGGPAPATPTIDGFRVQLVEEERAGPVGRVFAQDPQPGTWHNCADDRTIFARVSQRAEMTQLQGMSEDFSEGVLDGLGARLNVRYEPSPAAPGTVLAQYPPPGHAVPLEVFITVASSRTASRTSNDSSMGASDEGSRAEPEFGG